MPRLALVILLALLWAPANGQEGDEALGWPHSPVKSQNVVKTKGGEYLVYWFGRWQHVPSHLVQRHKQFYYEAVYNPTSGRILCFHIPEPIGG